MYADWHSSLIYTYTVVMYALGFGLGYMAICHINMEELAASLSSSYEGVQVFLP